MAAESAPVHERMWIEDTYHSIYCAATVSTRKMADDWLPAGAACSRDLPSIQPTAPRLPGAICRR
jgi:hypothetical protein